MCITTCLSIHVHLNLDTVVGGQCMCITTSLSIHVHLKPWHSGWWAVYVYHYLFINSRTFKPLTQWFGGQCMCITTCLSIHVYLNPWHSGWWSVYVYHYLFINSRTSKPLTQWLVVSVCVSLLVYQFTSIQNLDTVVGGQCMCITTCLSIHVHLNPWHSGWWLVYVYH